MADKIFSGDRDVLPEGEPIPVYQSGCLALLAAKAGCLLVLIAILLLVFMLAKLTA
jgi:hypothetical protein